MEKTFEFTSERLRYRGLRAEDAELVSAWCSVPSTYVNYFNAKPISVEDHIAWFAGYVNDESRYDFMLFDENGEPIGIAGLSGITKASCEVSYTIGAESARGKGYAKEAARALSELAFREFGVDEVVARVLSHNEASFKVAIGSGFSEYERVFKLRRPEAVPSCEGVAQPCLP